MKHLSVRPPAWLLRFGCGALIGAVLFLAVFGVLRLDPTYDNWILNLRSDSTEHYLGWRYYRQSEWQFPLGMTDGLFAGQAISCVYTDSIPLFAVFFKLLSPLLPAKFQYFGIWALLSFLMQGGLGTLILYRVTRSDLFSVIGTPVYVLTPYMLQRLMFSGHEALGGQWVLLLGIALCLYRDHKWKFRAAPVLLWTLCGMIAASVHVYFVPMLYLLWLAYAVTDYLMTQKLVRAGASLGCMTAGIAATLYVLGAFEEHGGYSAGGLGVFSANYNTFVNPMNYSGVLKALPYHASEQAEGFAYLGLGVLFGGVCVLLLLMAKLEQSGLRAWWTSLTRHRRVVLCVTAGLTVCSLIYAASPTGAVGELVLYSIPLPQRLVNFLSIFRCTGRFAWVSAYLLTTGIMAALSKLPPKRTAICLAAAVTLLQAGDLKGFLLTRRPTAREDLQYALNDPKWDEIRKGKTTFLFAPIEPDYLAQTDTYFTFAVYASEHHMTLSSFPAARTNFQELHDEAETALDRFLRGESEGNEIVVFLDDEAIPEENGHFELLTLNGYTVAVSK